MHEAMFYERLEGGAVRCFLCSHRCRISTGKRGICGVRENAGGTLDSLVYGKVVALHLDPIEKKPLHHYLPGTTSLSLATAGCNFRCLQCQNAEISQLPPGAPIPGRDTPPQDLVVEARAAGAASISYTYTEPTIFFEYAMDIGRLAHDAGLGNVFVTNGFITPEALEVTEGWLNAANVDLKAFSDETYKKTYGGRLQPVLDSIAGWWRRGVWVEVTTLVIPGINDSDAELADIAGYLASVSPDIPWHVSAFFPTYRLLDRPPTPPETLVRARDIGVRAGLRFVYVGNVPGAGGEDTACPSCGKTVILRRGYRVERIELAGGKCRFCGAVIPGRFLP
jgi:pyruvate formate lyase activating enzyme